MNISFNPSRQIYLGEWNFNKISLDDKDIYYEYINKSEIPANLWSGNFTFLWAFSQPPKRTILWKVIDDMLVTFAHTKMNELYLVCLPFGKGEPEKVVDLLYRCMTYCYKWNREKSNKTFIRMINDTQLEFLRNCDKFDKYFRLKKLQETERHYEVKSLISLKGKDFSNIRNKINKFHRENPDARIRKYKSSDFKSILRLNYDWINTAGKKYRNIFDKVYFKKIIKNYKKLNHLILVVEIKKQIVGVVTGEVLPNGQSWGCIIKYLPYIKGLCEAMVVEFAREINRINPNAEFLNTGGDLGTKGLSTFKEKFSPALNLQRYQVYLK